MKKMDNNITIMSQCEDVLIGIVIEPNDYSIINTKDRHYFKIRLDDEIITWVIFNYIIKNNPSFVCRIGNFIFDVDINSFKTFDGHIGFRYNSWDDYSLRMKRGSDRFL